MIGGIIEKNRLFSFNLKVLEHPSEYCGLLEVLCLPSPSIIR